MMDICSYFAKIAIKDFIKKLKKEKTSLKNIFYFSLTLVRKIQIAFLRKKTIMNSKWLLLVPGLIATACDYTVIREYDPHLPPPGELYAAALEFPEDYDWRRDPSGGEVTPYLVFYQDTTVIFRKPTGNGSLLLPDGDMHRISGTHLFSDCSTGTQTVIFKDGEELFRWDGREMLWDLEEMDGKLYTLSTSRDGDGWSYRCNGEIVLEQDYGRFLSGFYKDSGHLCFDYAKAISKDVAGIPDRNYHVSDGIDSLIVIPADVKKVLTSRMKDGVFNYIAVITGYDRLVWHAGRNVFVLEEEKTGKSPYCRLLDAGGEMVAMAKLDGRDCLWDTDGKKFFTTIGSRIYSICEKSAHLCFAISSRSGLSDVEIYYDGISERLPAEYVMLSPSCLSCDDYGFAVGANDMENSRKPVILRDKKRTDYDFNGYFICLALP